MSGQLCAPEGVPDWAWERIARREGNRWAIDERDETGTVIGTAYRDASGGKTCKTGSSRGLILPWPLRDDAGASQSDPVFVCEGASDTGAMLGLMLDAVGVPMAGHCGPMLGKLLRGRHVAIVADADESGRIGADKVAANLRGRCASVYIMNPPEGANDARCAVTTGADRESFLGELKDNGRDATQSVVNELLRIAGVGQTGPRITRLSDVKPEPVHWLWPGRIALGKLTLIAGDPGLGKSFMTLDVAARVSRGTPWPDARAEAQEPGGVVLLSAEDDVADTIRPRLDSAGADVSRIVALQSVPVLGDHGKRTGERMFDLTTDLSALGQAIDEVDDCRLVVIDPLTAYLGRTDSHKNGDIRGLLGPLAQFAAERDVAMLAVTHLNKNTGGAAIYRTMGSLAFTAAARAAWAVVIDRDDPARRLLLPIKNNLAPDTGGLAFGIVETDGGPCVGWEDGRVDVSADDALTPERGKPGPEADAREEATDWLRDELSGGPRAARELKDAAKRDGVALRTLDRAKKALGVVATREGYSSDGRWVWALPSPEPGAQWLTGQEPNERQETP